MKQLLAAVVALLVVSTAHAQWYRPGREVWVASNTWSYIPTTNGTVQKVVDWLDDELARFDGQIDSLLLTNSNWRVLPDTNALAPLITWIDDNWNTNIQPNGVYIPGSNIIGATRSGHDWAIPASGVGVSTSGWSTINPASTNVQAALDALNAFAGYADSNLNVATAAGAMKLAYNNGFGYTGSAVPTNTIPSESYLLWTNGTHAATASNTNILQWGTGGSLTHMIIKRAGTYWFYASVNSISLDNIYAYFYLAHYSSGGTFKGTGPVATTDSNTGPEPLRGAGVYLAIDAEVGDYVRLENTALDTSTGKVALGALYLFAYKVYNTD